MASRRKSAKPTNKARQQVELLDDDDDDDDDDDMESSTVSTGSSGVASREPIPKETMPDIYQHGKRPANHPHVSLNQSSDASNYIPMRLPEEGNGAEEPHIALPSDIYQDFEALKSATKLDTTELMRKLLTGYHMVASSGHPSRDRKLDDVIDNLFQSRSTNVLDLSKRNGASSTGYRCQQDSMLTSLQSHSFTDDQLAMGILDTMTDNDDTISDSKPLDLTLNKHERRPSLESAKTMSSAKIPQHVSTLHSTPASFMPSCSESQGFSQYFKQAGSYVINLEPRNNSPSFANSSLAQVLQMDIPLHSFSKIQKQAFDSPDNVSNKEGVNSVSPQPSSDATIQQCSNVVHFRSQLFHEDQQLSPGNTRCRQEANLSGSSSSNLPSYAEAVTSVLNSQKNKLVSGGRSKETVPFTPSAVDQDKQSYQPSIMSYAKINAEDPDSKFPSLSLNPQPASGSSLDNQKQQNLLQHLLQNQIKSETKLDQHTLQHTQSPQPQTPTTTSGMKPANETNVLHNPPSSHITMVGMSAQIPDLNDAKALPQTLKCSEAPYPNFLLESNTVGIPSISTAMASSTASPCTLPNASVPLSTFFMATSSNGGVGHMVAIPFIHAVPDGVSGYQPFAFAPHPIPTSSISSTSTTSSTSDVAPSSTMTPPAARASKQSSDMSHKEPASSVLFTSELQPPVEATKPKPGRPRGRGERGSSQKSQNKDMKLLTENTLFPGVYTSILKLPWSRRSRNKTKVTAISELKKQAQIIAHGKMSEEHVNLTVAGPVREDDAEKKNANTHDVSEKMLSSKIIENQAENCSLLLQDDTHRNLTWPDNRKDNQRNLMVPDDPEDSQRNQTLQDDREESQRNQMQQQKLKDLEQQKRLHLQYHLRLQEEQRKLTKQIEQSYVHVDTETSLPVPFAATAQQILQGKQDFPRPDTTKTGVSHQVVPMSLMPDATPFSQQSLSPDILTSGYSGTEGEIQNKKPRKRGRPPKIPNQSLTTGDSLLPFTTASIVASIGRQPEPENFLHANPVTMNSTSRATETRQSERESLFFTTPPAFDKDGDVSRAFLKSGDGEMTLEKKITFLTNQIGLELNKSRVPQSSGSNTTQNAQIQNSAEDSGNKQLDDRMYQEMKMAANKSLLDVKPRRKKVSRLLKSDDNFMYATFKIKPKGLTPRKSRRRKKDVLSCTASVAETIANLRKKTERESGTSSAGTETSKPLSMMAWKFHEQYPFTNEEEINVNKDRAVACLKCSSCFVVEGDGAIPHHCQTCLLESSEVPGGMENVLSKTMTRNTGGPEVTGEFCVTCGSVLQKHFSDPSVTCDLCKSNSLNVIKASKLFSFHDSSEDIAASGRITETKSSTTGPFLESPGDSQVNNKCIANNSSGKANSNHIFCSQCRMVFNKICDYLAHIRDTHDTKLDKKNILTSEISLPSDAIRKPRISKTKKSLAHKTLTCPVEECPHFFREKKDLDLHVLKKHSHLSSGPHGECGYSYAPAEDLDSNQQLHPSASTSAVMLTTATAAAAAVAQLNILKNVENDSVNAADTTLVAVTSCEKPLRCEFCDYRCRQKNALTWHMRKHPESASQYRRYNNLSVD